MPRTRAEESEADETLRAEIGARLRTIRESAGLSLPKFAARLNGRDPNNIARTERGESWVSVQQLAAICREFGASADYIVLGAGDPPAQRKRKPFELVATPDRAKPDGRKDAVISVTTRIPPAVAAYLVREGNRLRPELVEMLKRTDYAGLGLTDITPDEVRKFVAALDFESESDDD